MTTAFKINNFDLIRIFAAIQVLIIHSAIHLNVSLPWISFLAHFPGVPIFFVISGFLISASWERNNNIKTYLQNRILRIYPALWCCVLLTIPVISVAGKINFINAQTVPWIATQLLGIIYTPAFLADYGFGSYNGSLWTTPIELQFYVILPLIFASLKHAVKKESGKTFIFILLFVMFVIAAYIIQIYYSNSNLKLETRHQKILRYTFIPHLYLFLLGVVLQRIKAYKSSLIYGKGLLLLAGYILFSYFTPNGALFTIAGQIFLGITAVSVAYTFPYLAKKMLNGNDISYGVYIYHGLILGALVELKLTGSLLYILVVLISACACGFISWVFVEKPILTKKKKNAIHELSNS
jgi:peptidoglycan/LPS O-acetylase OafA/YrhL